MNPKAEPIRILYLVTAFGRGGVESYIANVISHIDRDRFSFVLVGHNKNSDHDEATLRALGVEFHHLDLPTRIGFMQYIRNAATLIDRYDVQIVHIQTFYGFLFTIVSRLTGHKTIVHSHGTKINYSDKGAVQRIASLAMKMILRYGGTTRVAAGLDAGRFLFGKKKFEVLENGIELEGLAYNETTRQQLRRDLKIPDRDTVVMCVGRMAYPKNQVFAVDVFSAYLKSQPNAWLVMVGDGEDRPYIEKRVDEFGIMSRVVFTGMRRDVGNLLNIADVLILPSISEGFPLISIECQANGLKMIVSDAVDASINMLGDIEFCSLLDSSEKWAERMAQMDMSRNKYAYSMMAASPYNVNNSIKKLENLYEKLVRD